MQLGRTNSGPVDRTFLEPAQSAVAGAGRGVPSTVPQGSWAGSQGVIKPLDG